MEKIITEWFLLKKKTSLWVGGWVGGGEGDEKVREREREERERELKEAWTEGGGTYRFTQIICIHIYIRIFPLSFSFFP
jgi:hypothetical protein